MWDNILRHQAAGGGGGGASFDGGGGGGGNASPAGAPVGAEGVADVASDVVPTEYPCAA